ncbi:T9SS sorting signal type C domain-containing protein [Flavobacterium amniphilum]|nr:T9SS sorting signal type C domain-containing protein [Flavobacterium amniphilum]MCL9804617.1 T9SS sorting signal type C domain-containing protein [Flavobacterium amniphilum]
MTQFFCLLLFVLLSPLQKTIAQANDCTASLTSLTIGATCTTTNYTVSSSFTNDGPTPCSGTSYRDGWYSFTTDATTNSITITGTSNRQMGLAVYSGTCASPSSIACEVPNNANATLTTAVTPNTTYRLRIMRTNNANTNDMTGTICIAGTVIPIAPTGCTNTTQYPSSSVAAPSAGNTATISTCNYQTEYNAISGIVSGTTYTFTNSAGGFITIRSGSYNGTVVASGNSPLSFTAASSGTFYVHYNTNSSCGTASNCTTTSVTNGTASGGGGCTPGSGTGTSAAGCPSVVSGGLGLSGSDPAAITCSTSSCVDLEATYLQLGQTTSYSVQSIPYSPPYQFGCLANAVSVNTDDVWSPTINLPFNFCFYGTNYNQCLIGSNGVLTFDTTNNTPGGFSEWEFIDNLPNAALFRNSIFGVYHDIDPSVGGTVGWELVTLSTGCRALVASWNDIPMFSSSCNSILYTGMMVLYENTNIIEVYIKQKSVCASWNSGNAIVGVQNGAGTVGTVAPNRNGLSPDWTTTNEAWRFVPSGTSITSIKWYQGAGTGGPVVGTTDVINVCPAATTTYTAEVTYTLCSGSTVKVTDQTTVTVSGNKVWNGSVNTDWNTAANWTPSGVPNNTQPVVIANVTNKPVITGGINAQACSLTVQTGAQLTVATNNNITVTNGVTVQGTGAFIINDDASLVQVNNVTNTGNIQYSRTANIRRQDYVYWSSPVANFSSSSISPGTNSGYIYKWLPSTTTGYTSNFGNWTNGNETMVTGKGYIVRGPDAYSSSAATNYTATFIGVPNNGTITSPISRSTYNGTSYVGPTSTLVTANDDNWNLIGNPYPSSIRAIDFLNANTNLAGFINVWTHGTLPVSSTDPFYANYNYNYTSSDYITYNSAGASSGPGTFGGYVGSGQSFFTIMNHSTPSTTGTVTFTNAMRSATYANSQFFRDSDNNNTIEPEYNRIWLDLIKSSDNTNRRTLVGYMDGATNDKDRMYDALGSEKLSFNIYSLLNNEIQVIQGKALPFDSNDTIALGVGIPETGEYKIGIAAVDGLFENRSQNIFLEDKLLNITHDLKESPYTFTAQKERFNDRFILKYINQALSNDDFVSPNDIKIFAMGSLNVESSKLDINEISVYDVLGKKLLNLKNIQQKQITISQLKPTTNVILVKVTLENGSVVTKKVIY